MAPNPMIQALSLYYNSSPGNVTVGSVTYAATPIPTMLNGTTLTQDQRVLTYALAAELLEFQLYLQAYLYVTGGSITVGGTTYTTVTDALGYTYGSGNLTLATTVAPDPATPSGAVASYLAEFTQIEYAHGQYLIGQLGGNPYTQAAGSAIEFAFGLHTLTTEVAVAQAIYGAELTGVSAYTGAIPSFSNPTVQQYPSYLQIAASILGTEARHTTALAAAINALNGNGAIETAPQYNEGGPVGNPHGTDVPLTPDQILNTGSGSTNVPGVLLPSGASAGTSGGTLGPISGPNGAAVGPANGTTTPTYNGFVYLVTTPVGQL